MLARGAVPVRSRHERPGDGEGVVGAIRADSFIFDLEDAVAASAKGEARENVAAMLEAWGDDGDGP